MKRFNGFPSSGRVEFTPLPNVFFSSLLPQIDDLAELKTTLHVMAVLYRKKGYPRYVTYTELLKNTSLVNSLKGIAGPPDEVLRGALQKAAGRGTILHIVLDRDGVSEDIYFLNDESSRQVIARIQNGELELSGMQVKGPAYIAAEELPDIFTLYEQNIGMLTPMIADELREAEKLYPEGWIKDAIRESVLHNKRNIKYILKILESWAVEGRSDGTYQRHIKKTDPDRYFKGKYGHMVRR